VVVGRPGLARPLVVRGWRRHGPHPFAQPSLLVGEGGDIGLGVGELRRPEQRVVRADLHADPAVHAQREIEELRVSAKKKDDLQSVISLVKSNDFGLALQFVNYR